MNMANTEIALEIMGKGMGGIFAAIAIVVLAVMVLGKATRKEDREEQIEDKKQKIEKREAGSRKQKRDMSPGSFAGNHTLLD